MANEQNNQAQVTQEKYLNAPLWRVFLADLLTKVENWFITKYNAIMEQLAHSTSAQANSLCLGLQDTVETFGAPIDLRPTIDDPSNPGTDIPNPRFMQPQWDFAEDTIYPLGTFIDYNASTGQISIPTYNDGWSDVPSGYTRIAVPTTITDTDGGSHVTFPEWVWDETNGYRWQAGRFAYRHNLSLEGGHNEGIDWTVLVPTSISLVSGAVVLEVSDATGLSVGKTWVRIIETVGEDALFRYGFVSAISGTTVTVTVVGAAVASASNIGNIEIYQS